jgi:ABC-type multidrug transport system fused ATPase/permease subunit
MQKRKKNGVCGLMSILYIYCHPISTGVLQRPSSLLIILLHRSGRDMVANTNIGAWYSRMEDTGSGKSTLIQALFLIVEPSRGNILIDGIDISKIGLHDIRSKLSIIPQDPTMFEVNLRTNIDPLGEHSDTEIWEALKKYQLEEIMNAKEKGLDSLVTENGENWSVGQRQLVCLGRALLKSTCILVLDEATTSVHSATDNLMQQTLHYQFSDYTVIVVAHRIPTAMDSDLVLVLNDGRISEFDSPMKLLEDMFSSFSKLVSEYSLRSKVSQ